MEERYRKIVCPNGHASEAIRENDPLPRRCTICRQQYLKNVKPIWCDKNGNVEEDVQKNATNADSAVQKESLCNSDRGKDAFTDMGAVQETVVRRRKRTSFLDAPKETNFHTNPAEASENVNERVAVSVATYYLKCGDYLIKLSGEGILGRENTGRECLAVDQLVSRAHCYYLVTDQLGLQIKDAGSLNGTFADTGEGRVAVSKDKSISLKKGDKLWLADMLFEIKEDL